VRLATPTAFVAPVRRSASRPPATRWTSVSLAAFLRSRATDPRRFVSRRPWRVAVPGLAAFASVGGSVPAE